MAVKVLGGKLGSEVVTPEVLLQAEGLFSSVRLLLKSCGIRRREGVERAQTFVRPNSTSVCRQNTRASATKRRKLSERVADRNTWTTAAKMALCSSATCWNSDRCAPCAADPATTTPIAAS
jgi:hypothetical protein